MVNYCFIAWKMDEHNYIIVFWESIYNQGKFHAIFTKHS
jgi:hypothetical protein